ncbi:hypothetical protein [Methylobacterium radiodurans]|uniref:hypothetical protein n=1 Tax=Methylobacterium radiodurans TaxID=2202828 RepID=UPI001FEAFF03|nr:hypothetical protein [Methylobacterium radiodurans]
MSPSPASPAQPSRLTPTRIALLTACLAALGGCQALSGSGGVMPAGDVGPPPSLRSSLPNRPVRGANVDEDGRPLQTAPTRSLDLPKNARGETRAAAQAERRIRREDIEGGNAAGGTSSGSMSPALTPSGGVGMGGRF